MSTSIIDAFMTVALIICLFATSALAAERDYASLRQEVVQRLDAFRAQTSRAADRGIDVVRERVTITTAELFLNFADWDAGHRDELKEAIGAWWVVRDQADGIGQALPERELQEVLETLEAATRELAAVEERPDSRRPVPASDATRLELADGYFRFQGRPVFPSSFVWMPGDEKLVDAYGEIGGTYIHPPNLQPGGVEARLRYEPGGDNEPMGYVFFGHSQMPKWVLAKHPDIKIGARHFTAYDIDHPVTRQVWKDLLAAAVPRFAGRKVSQGGYLLANEPHWFSAVGEWATGPVSKYTYAKFRTWLKERHGTIDKLNQLWGKDFASFGDVSLQVPIDGKLQGTPVWYDWCRFNMHRVTEWFAFLKAEIRRHDPEGKVHLKLIPGQWTGASRSHGLDFETLVRLQDIIGCDAQATSTKSWRDKGDWDKRYACLWRNLSMSYDFFHSVGPEKLLFDSEFHGLSTVHWRDPNMPPEYVRCLYWLAHLHGMGMNQTWYWGRNADGSPKENSRSGFYASNLTLPRVMDAFGRTMKELNAFAPEVVALARQPKPIRLFYSETSAIQDPEYMGHVFDAYQALYHSGTPLGFATGRMLAEATETELRRWPVLIVTHANRVTTNELEALSRYAATGGTLIIAGAESLKRDEYGRPHSAVHLAGQGRVIRLVEKDAPSLSDLVTAALRRADMAPAVTLTETNEIGQPGCVWRTAPWEGGQLLLILNLGKGQASIALADQSPLRDLIANAPQPSTFTMKSFEVKLLHVQDAEAPGPGL